MQQVDFKSVSNFKDFTKYFFFRIFYLKAQLQFQVINPDICDCWIGNYLWSDWLKGVRQVN